MMQWDAEVGGGSWRKAVALWSLLGHACAFRPRGLGGRRGGGAMDRFVIRSGSGGGEKREVQWGLARGAGVDLLMSGGTGFGKRGWKLKGEEGSKLLWCAGDAPHRAKVLGLDLDGTVVTTVSGGSFAQNARDWKWFNEEVRGRLRRAFAEEGYKVVIFTNQGAMARSGEGAKAEQVKDRIDLVRAALGSDVPVTVLAAVGKEIKGKGPHRYRKPEPGMWQEFCDRLNGGVQIDMSASLYVGDAAGRAGDFADTDRKFADAVGLKFLTPEEFFVPQIEGAREDETVVADGPPAAKRAKAEVGQVNGDP